VRQDGERALVLAALTGDGSIKEKGVSPIFTQGIYSPWQNSCEWELLKWYAEVKGKQAGGCSKNYAL